jgi:hypothetical protein
LIPEQTREFAATQEVEAAEAPIGAPRETIPL